jgi:hypothetical protein
VPRLLQQLRRFVAGSEHGLELRIAINELHDKLHRRQPVAGPARDGRLSGDAKLHSSWAPAAAISRPHPLVDVLLNGPRLAPPDGDAQHLEREEVQLGTAYLEGTVEASRSVRNAPKATAGGRDVARRDGPGAAYRDAARYRGGDQRVSFLWVIVVRRLKHSMRRGV